MEDGIIFNQSKYIKEMLKKFRLKDSKPTKTPMSTKIKLTKDDKADSMDSSKYRGEIMPQTNQKDYQLTKAYLPRIHCSKAMNEEVRESYCPVGLEHFLTLDEPICPRFVTEFYHSLEVKRDEEERPYIEFKLGQFTFELDTSQLSRIFQTPKALETFYTSKWFTFHERVMNPLDISRNPTKEKGKRVASPSASSSSSLSPDENETPSFLKIYEDLSDNEDLTDAQREKRRMFKCLNRYFGTITKYLKNQK
ncbi:hypothetical protein Tco_1466180 [Tanacetum coccineum]